MKRICFAFFFLIMCSSSPIDSQADPCNGVVTINSEVHAPLDVTVSSSGVGGNVLGQRYQMQATITRKNSPIQFELPQVGGSIEIYALSPARSADTYKLRKTLLLDKCEFTLYLMPTGNYRAPVLEVR